jgi:hypothetical protein
MSQFAVLVNARGNGVGDLQLLSVGRSFISGVRTGGFMWAGGVGEQFSTPRCRMG